jgi:hypothetical protein
VIKFRKMNLEWHVARIGGEERCIQGGWGNLTEEDHLEDPGVGGMLIIKCIFKKWNGEAWTELIWLCIGTGGSRLLVR